MTAFLAISVVLTLGAITCAVYPLLVTRPQRAPLAAFIAGLFVSGTTVGLYLAVSEYPWGSDSAQDPESRIASLNAHLGRNPADLAAWQELAGIYAGTERYAEAREALRQAVALDSSRNLDLRLSFAEVAILADPASLAGEAGELLEEILVQSPREPRALWYGGMAALRRGDATVARTRWSTLLEGSPPEPVRKAIEQQIAALDRNDSGAETREERATP